MRLLQFCACLVLLTGCGEQPIPTVIPPPPDAQELAWQKASHDPVRIANGEKLWKGAGACVTCHGLDALGREFTATPSLLDDRWKHGSRMGDMISLMRKGHERMPAVMNIDDEGLLDLACYVADRNRREKNHQDGIRIPGEKLYPIDY